VDDPVALCADAYAAWHAAWLTALGLRSERTDGVWRALDRPPEMYFTGITLAPDVPAEAVADVPGSVGDAWQTLDLTPWGRRVTKTEPWFHRAAGPLPDGEVLEELELVRVSTPAEVEEFEAVSVRGFGGEGDTIPPGTIHPATVLSDPDMVMVTGRVDGEAVAAAMGYRTERAVGVFGVTTVAPARRRGYGTAVTRAAMLTETGLPSILAPSKEAESMYLRLGFRRVGELSIWGPKEGPGP
jgi:hypothetical protein